MIHGTSALGWAEGSSNSSSPPYATARQKVLLTDTEPGQKAFYEALGYRQAGGDASADDGGLALRAFVRFDG